MIFQGTIHNGVVVFEPTIHLPEGAAVRVELVKEASLSKPTAIDDGQLDPIWRMGELAVDTGITDLAVNIDHCLYGHPKVKDVQ